MAERPAIVYIVAHPDDLAYSLGGAALLLTERRRLHVLGEIHVERVLGARAGCEHAEAYAPALPPPMAQRRGRRAGCAPLELDSAATRGTP